MALFFQSPSTDEGQSLLSKSSWSIDYKRQDKNTTGLALMVQDELSAEKPKNAADTGIPVTNDQVKLALFGPSC